jgi:hypothetical protein
LSRSKRVAKKYTLLFPHPVRSTTSKRSRFTRRSIASH